MALPDELRSVLPSDTVQIWELIAPAVPQVAYLVGGTAVAVHLRHRPSRDLDFFFHGSVDAVDLDQLATKLSEPGPYSITERSPGTLNGVFSRTRVQFLDADLGSPQRRLEPTLEVAGIQVAGIADLLATKLKVIADRGELRDYFDLMIIERDGGRSIEEGLGLFVERYRPVSPPTVLAAIVRALGYLDDIDEDELLPVSKAEIERYWKRRQPQLVQALDRHASGGPFGPLAES